MAFNREGQSFINNGQAERIEPISHSRSSGLYFTYYSRSSSKATLSAVAKKVERQVHVISKQAVKMENDGLIMRIKDTPKSRLLRLELTEKGLELIKVSRQSKLINAIFSYLSVEQRQQLESILNLILIKLEERNLIQS
jgi:DNA-binding MarR family transcriptional regulator